MQRWRTRHDVRGICYLEALLAPVADFTAGALDSLIPSAAGALTPFTGVGADLGNALAGAGMGAAVNTGGGGGTPFNPLQALQGLFSGGAAAAPDAPQVYQQNPTITQTAGGANSPFTTNVDISQITGRGGDAKASGGGPFSVSVAKGGNAGSNYANVSVDPTYNLSSNLPGVPSLPTAPNLLTGGAMQNVMTRPNMMPIPNPNSPMGMMMNTVQPIAAGGISPVFAAMMSAPQQQQMAQPGQMVIPGSATQAGGYDMPPPPLPQGPMSQSSGMMSPPMPQGGGMPQMPMGGGMPSFPPQFMAMQMGPGGPLPTDQGAPMPGLRPYTPPQPQGMQATAGSLGGPQPAPQRQPLKGGTAQATKPESLLDHTRNEIAKEMKELAKAPMDITNDAIKQYQKRLDDAQKADDIATAEPAARHDAGQRGMDTSLAKAQDYADPDKTALTDDHKKQVDKAYNDLGPRQKKLYDLSNGTKQNSKLATAMSWLHTLSRAGVAGFQPFTTGALNADTERSKSIMAEADKVYNRVHEQADKMLTHQLDQSKEVATIEHQKTTASGADLRGLQTKFNEEQNQAEKQTIGVANAAGTSIGHTAAVLDDLVRIMHGATEEDLQAGNQQLAKQRLGLSQSELAVNQGGLKVRQDADARAAKDEPGIEAERTARTNYYNKLTGGTGPAIPPTILQTMGENPSVTSAKAGAAKAMSDAQLLMLAKKYGINASKK